MGVGLRPRQSRAVRPSINGAGVSITGTEPDLVSVLSRVEKTIAHGSFIFAAISP